VRAEPDNLRMLAVVIDAKARRAYSAFGVLWIHMTTLSRSSSRTTELLADGE
jgi:hypothetical protein